MMKTLHLGSLLTEGELVTLQLMASFMTSTLTVNTVVAVLRACLGG